MTNNILLDEPLSVAAVGGAEALAILTDAIDDFFRQRDLAPPEWPANPTPRTILRPYLDAYRMAGQEVFLHDAELVGINISLSVRVRMLLLRAKGQPYMPRFWYLDLLPMPVVF